jgi:hypothetical protein
MLAMELPVKFRFWLTTVLSVAGSLELLDECMVLRLNAREKLMDERKSASMYPAFRWR